MSLVRLPAPILYSPMEAFPFTLSTGSMTLDAAGESAGVVGYISLSTGPGTSKVLSAAGSGKIHVFTGTTTFANAGTNVRIGVNDVAATGVEDGTHDVFADLTGGGGGLGSITMNAVTMTSGTKTIAHGDLVAIVAEMTTRAGVDSVIVSRNAPPNGCVTPYGTVDSGAGPIKSNSGGALMAIEFDDGTLGYFQNIVPYIRVASSAFQVGSTPDEHALVFQVPFACEVTGLYALLSALAATDDFELILYSDPLGTPVAERTLTQDMDLADINVMFSREFSTPYTLAANTNYAIALRPTTANTIGYQTMGLGTNGGNLRKFTPFGTNCSHYSRTNQSGAFGSADNVNLPQFGIWISSLHDGAAGGGGGTHAFPFIG